MGICKRNMLGVLCALLAGVPVCALAGEVVPDMDQGEAYEYARRRAGEEVDAAWKIHVSEDGLYRITGAVLRQTGINSPQGSQLRLFCKGREVAVRVSTSGVMSDTDSLLFYGEAHQGTYTTTNVYWLGLGEGGKRWTTVDGTPRSGWSTTDRYQYTYRYAPELLYRPFYRQLDDSMNHWFANLLRDDQNTDLSRDSDSALVTSGNATLALRLYGLSSAASVDPDHATRVTMGGYEFPLVTYDGATEKNVSMTFPATHVQNTTITLRQVRQAGVSDPGDRAYLKSLELTYPRYLHADGYVLSFTNTSGSRNYVLNNFKTTNYRWVLDVSDAAEPRHVLNAVRASSGMGYSHTFALSSTSGVAVSVTDDGLVKNISSLEYVRFRELAATDREADYVVICPYTFRDQVYRLLTKRHLQKLRVAVAPISDIYNEFSYGITDADAIKQFVGYAFHHWKGRPKYVLLVGDGSYDPKNNLKVSGAAEIIPVHLDAAPYEYCAMDGWFGAVSGDDYLPDVAIGRLPVRTADECSIMVDKIITYEEQAQYNNHKALLAADNADSIDYEAASETWAAGPLSTKSFGINRVYVRTAQNPQQEIIDHINAGCKAVNYFGHGALDFWAAEDIFNNDQVAQLWNSVWPIFTMLTCENGNFDEPEKDCLAEALLKAERRGAVGCVAASALPVQYYSEIFADGYYRAFVHASSYSRLGDVMLHGLGELWAGSPGARELMTYSLLGDPAMKVK